MIENTKHFATPEAEAKHWRRMLKFSCMDWADDDTRVKEIAGPLGFKIEDDYGFVGIVDIVEEMASEIVRLRNK